MATVYILYSKDIDSYYIGSCKDIEIRLEDHIEKKYKNSYTTRAEDWEVVCQLNNLSHIQARNIEAHIKRMKSKKYINDLCKYHEISLKLQQKYQ